MIALKWKVQKINDSEQEETIRYDKQNDCWNFYQGGEVYLGNATEEGIYYKSDNDPVKLYHLKMDHSGHIYPGLLVVISYNSYNNYQGVVTDVNKQERTMIVKFLDYERHLTCKRNEKVHRWITTETKITHCGWWVREGPVVLPGEQLNIPSLLEKYP